MANKIQLQRSIQECIQGSEAATIMFHSFTYFIQRNDSKIKKENLNDYPLEIFYFKWFSNIN